MIATLEWISDGEAKLEHGGCNLVSHARKTKRKKQLFTFVSLPCVAIVSSSVVSMCPCHGCLLSTGTNMRCGT